MVPLSPPPSPTVPLLHAYPDIWERVGCEFVRRRNKIQAVAERRMARALDTRPPEIAHTVDDRVAMLRAVDAHHTNFAIRLPVDIKDLAVGDIYLIDW